jgi:hypothetical protein
MRALKVLKVVLFVALAVTVFGWATKELWNWLMPSIFGLRPITFFEAIGLCLLGKILFGGFHKHGHGNHRGWKRKMKERWANMSEEERERFRSGMKARWNCGGLGQDERRAEQSVR